MHAARQTVACSCAHKLTRFFRTSSCLRRKGSAEIVPTEKRLRKKEFLTSSSDFFPGLSFLPLGSLCVDLGRNATGDLQSSSQASTGTSRRRENAASDSSAI
ncbi:hypothetical protein TGRH88_031270 [Toxoplasma gondii]|uniref:Uncharacterized protein n=1 Tax=Toxoplasma gondii TaxID=5811 RepID=A0A7J6KAD6_TOXGO|nr:hypothetical protein TGRH88_031270 [Toxoplasma gondii]